MTGKKFRGLFHYDQSKVGYVGVERECFTANKEGVIVPQAHAVLKYLSGDSEFGYELSACQVETRIGPCHLEELPDRLGKREAQLGIALDHCGLIAVHTEVGSECMPLDVYPDPTGRYKRITQDMPREILSAACRVIGTHVHIGMFDHGMALRVYNHVAGYFTELCEAGDSSSGGRLAIYKKMAPDFEPKPYASWDEYYQAALQKGFAEDPRRCWTFIRISVHGTIEFRMFGATESIGRIVRWATRCHELCQQAM